MMAGAEQVAMSGRRSAEIDVSHNLNGQRLGRKGRDTRARIIAVAQEIIADSPEAMMPPMASALLEPASTRSLPYFLEREMIPKHEMNPCCG